MKKVNKKKNNTLIIGILFLGIVILFTLSILYQQKYNTVHLEKFPGSMAPTPDSQAIPISSSASVSRLLVSEKKGWKTYENYIGGYAIDFPDTLNMYESNTHLKSAEWDSTRGQLCITDGTGTDPYPLN